MMRRDLRAALLLLGVLTLVCGGVYPGVVTGLAWLMDSRQPDSRTLGLGGQVVGLEGVGQEFSGPGWFQGRPSLTADEPYNAASSGASNLSPANPDLRLRVAARCAAFRELDPDNREPIPVDLVTASGSGLDPHISPEAALWQAARVARARNLPAARVDSLVQAQVEPAWLGLLGKSRVNVLRLNLALHHLAGHMSVTM